MTADLDNQILLEKILLSIESHELELPVLPDVAPKIRALLDDPNSSADDVVRAISNDSAIAAQIIKVANSAVFFDKPLVENVRDAVSRIGFKMLRNVVMSLTVGNLFKSSSPFLNSKLKQVWFFSQEVAAISYVVALRQKYLNPEQAMLAGLIHNIGVLPICLYLSKNNVQILPDQIEELIQYSHARVGAILLKHWNFPFDLIDSVVGHQDIQRNSGSTAFADYTDCVLVANVMAKGVAKFTAWENVSAVTRLGFSKEECQFFLEKFEDQIRFAENMLGLATEATTETKPAAPQPIIAPVITSPPKPKEDRGLIGLVSKLWK